MHFRQFCRLSGLRQLDQLVVNSRSCRNCIGVIRTGFDKSGWDRPITPGEDVHEHRSKDPYRAAGVGCRRRPGERAGLCPATAEAEHCLHHGRRHRLDAAQHLSSRPDGRRNAQHRPHRQRRRDLHGLRRHAELHLRPQRVLHRHVPPAHGHDPAATARQPELPASRNARGCQGSARSRLQHRRVRQEPLGRSHRCAADGARLPGILGLSLSPRRHAAGELPRHQQDAHRSGRRAAVQEHADSRRAGRAGRRRSENHHLPDAAASGPLTASPPMARRRTRPARTKAR